MKKLILFISCVLISCQNSEDKKITEENATTIVLQDQTPVPVSSFIEEIHVLPLESEEEHLIGGIDNILFTKDRIIVSDMKISKSVYIFDRNGKKQAVINRLGRGPQEYLLPFYTTLTPDEKKIAIYDNMGSKVLFYDLDGNFIEKKNVNFTFMSFEYIDENNIVCVTYLSNDPKLKKANANGNMAIFTDGDFNIKTSALHNPYGDNAQFPIIPEMRKLNGEIFLPPAFCDTVYKVVPTFLTPHYYLDLSAIGNTPHITATTSHKEYSDIMNHSTLFYGAFVENSSFVMFLLSKDRTIKEKIFDKRTKKTFSLTRDYTVNKSTATEWFDVYLLNSKYVCDDQFVTAIPAYEILMGYSAIAQVFPQLTGLTQDSNPVLVFYKLKHPEQPEN